MSAHKCQAGGVVQRADQKGEASGPLRGWLQCRLALACRCVCIHLSSSGSRSAERQQSSVHGTTKPQPEPQAAARQQHGVHALPLAGSHLVALAQLLPHLHSPKYAAHNLREQQQRTEGQVTRQEVWGEATQEGEARAATALAGTQSTSGAAQRSSSSCAEQGSADQRCTVQGGMPHGKREHSTLHTISHAIPHSLLHPHAGTLTVAPIAT